MGNTFGSSNLDVEVLIIGAGPTGLGAAYRYYELVNSIGVNQSDNNIFFF